MISAEKDVTIQQGTSVPQDWQPETGSEQGQAKGVGGCGNQARAGLCLRCMCGTAFRGPSRGQVLDGSA